MVLMVVAGAGVLLMLLAATCLCCARCCDATQTARLQANAEPSRKQLARSCGLGRELSTARCPTCGMKHCVCGRQRVLKSGRLRRLSLQVQAASQVDPQARGQRQRRAIYQAAAYTCAATLVLGGGGGAWALMGGDIWLTGALLAPLAAASLVATCAGVGWQLLPQSKRLLLMRGPEDFTAAATGTRPAEVDEVMLEQGAADAPGGGATRTIARSIDKHGSTVMVSLKDRASEGKSPMHVPPPRAPPPPPPLAPHPLDPDALGCVAPLPANAPPLLSATKGSTARGSRASERSSRTSSATPRASSVQASDAPPADAEAEADEVDEDERHSYHALDREDTDGDAVVLVPTDIHFAAHAPTVKAGEWRGPASRRPTARSSVCARAVTAVQPPPPTTPPPPPPPTSDVPRPSPRLSCTAAPMVAGIGATKPRGALPPPLPGGPAVQFIAPPPTLPEGASFEAIEGEDEGAGAAPESFPPPMPGGPALTRVTAPPVLPPSDSFSGDGDCNDGGAAHSFPPQFPGGPSVTRVTAPPILPGESFSEAADDNGDGNGGGGGGGGGWAAPPKLGTAASSLYDVRHVETPRGSQLPPPGSCRHSCGAPSLGPSCRGSCHEPDDERPPPPPDPDPHDLPDGWVPCQDVDGNVFYHHLPTGETAWEPPQAPPSDVPPHAALSAGRDMSSFDICHVGEPPHASSAAPESFPPPLPGGPALTRVTAPPTLPEGASFEAIEGEDEGAGAAPESFPPPMPGGPALTRVTAPPVLPPSDSFSGDGDCNDGGGSSRPPLPSGPPPPPPPSTLTRTPSMPPKMPPPKPSHVETTRRRLGNPTARSPKLAQPPTPGSILGAPSSQKPAAPGAPPPPLSAGSRPPLLSGAPHGRPAAAACATRRNPPPPSSTTAPPNSSAAVSDAASRSVCSLTPGSLHDRMPARPARPLVTHHAKDETAPTASPKRPGDSFRPSKPKPSGIKPTKKASAERSSPRGPFTE